MQNTKQIDAVKQIMTEIVSFGKSPAVIFVRTKAEVRSICAMLNDANGGGFIGVTGELTSEERKQYAVELNEGKYLGAVSTTVWSTGIDIPNLRLVVLMDGIESPIPIIQEAGRGARKKEGMEFEVLIVGTRKKVKTIVDNLGKVGYNKNEINVLGEGFQTTLETEQDPTPGCLRWALCEQAGPFLFWVLIIFLYLTR